MKILLILLTAVITNSMTAQVLTYQQTQEIDLPDGYKLQEYHASDGQVFKIGDNVTLINPEGVQLQFVSAYLKMGKWGGGPLKIGYAGYTFTIDRLEYFTTAGQHGVTIIDDENNNSFYINIEQALAQDEIETAKNIRKRTVEYFKEMKELHDLGLLTDERFSEIQDSIRVLMSKQ